MELGAQLYTLRKYASSLNDFAETLKKVSDIGYRTVQVSGTCAYEPDWLAEQLAANDLRCVLTHSDANFMQENPATVVDKHKTFACKYIGIGSMPYKLDEYNTFRDSFKNVARVFAENDCLLMFHNHAGEFTKSDNGLIYLERMMNDFTPEEMGFTLDTYWVQAGGGDPAWWIKKLSGRVSCVHLKDMLHYQGIRMAPIYEGNMNFDAILAACAEAGTEYLLIEQDDCYGDDPFDCLALSYKNLSERGFN